MADNPLLARVVAAVASYEGIDGLGNDWTEDSDEPALIALLVLDALGLEQVGWWVEADACFISMDEAETYGAVCYGRLSPVYKGATTNG